MKVKRLRRYKDKLDLISERVNDIRTWTHSVDPKEFPLDKKTKLATYKAMQEVVEASMDICSMLVTDSKILVKDDYSNIGMLYKKGIIDKNLRSALEEANGLRNRLVHNYNTLKDEVAFTSIQNLLEKFENFIDKISLWIRKNS